MGKLTAFARVVIITCSDGLDDAVEGAYGQAINLSCTASNSLPCNIIYWQNSTSNGFVLTADTDRTSISILGRTSVLHISRLTLDDVGTYTCWCYLANGTSSSSVCSVALTTICQAKLLVNGETSVYNSSLRSNSHSVDVTAGKKIHITCSEGATLRSTCANNPLPVSGELISYKFEVLMKHKLCRIKCRIIGEDGDSRSVGFTLDVARLETSTPHSTTTTIVSTVSFHPSVNGKALTTTSTRNTLNVPTSVVTASDKPSVNHKTSTMIPNWYYTTMPIVQKAEKDNVVPDKSGSFLVMVPIGISIAIFVGFLFISCFSVSSSRSKSTFRPKKTQTLGNKSPDTNIPIGPTYATVNISSAVCSKGDDDSERGISCTDDAYAEINSAIKEESSTQQVNAIKAETSITKDYYFVVNTSNTKLEPMGHGNEFDSALYTEINEGVKQAGENVASSSPERFDCNSNVPDVQSYDVLEQLESSAYDVVGVVSTSPAFYADVEKEVKE